MKSHFCLPINLRVLALSAAIAAALNAPLALAQADDHAEVDRLLRAGQASAALSKADAFLANKPRDPQMRFLKGVIQTETGKTSEAIATFVKLTEDYPELPEPYNNLAVLYAGQSQFDKARAALQMAIRTNPSYATAHENLGDVYAKLASQAYSKALQLDASNAGVQPKLSLIRNLFAVEDKGTRPAAMAAASTTAVPPTAAVLGTPVAPTVAKPAGPAVTTQPPTPTASTAASAVVAQADVEAAVQAWAKAWSSKNMTAYLGSYAPNFTPAGGQSRRQWEADRRARILPRTRIEVNISDLSISMNGDRAIARFQQAYASDNLNVSSRKVLELVRKGNLWLIVRESTGS